MDGVLVARAPGHVPEESADHTGIRRSPATRSATFVLNSDLIDRGWVVVRLWDLDILKMPEQAVDQVVADPIESWAQATSSESRSCDARGLSPRPSMAFAERTRDYLCKRGGTAFPNWI